MSILAPLMPHRVARTQITPDCYVSTIDLALQPGYTLRRDTARFQTQVRGGPHHEVTHHAWTKIGALAVHYAVVDELREDLADAGGYHPEDRSPVCDVCRADAYTIPAGQTCCTTTALEDFRDVVS